MINCCGNCANYVWGDNKTPLPSECITCTTSHVPNGQHPTPSHWKAKPQTNADRIRAMSDEELAEQLITVGELDEEIHFCKNLPECDDLLNTEDGVPLEKCRGCLLNWLKQPAEVKDNA